MNLALLGYGSIARSHMKALAGEDVRLRTVMGRLSEPTAAFAAEYGFERHTIDLDEVVGDPAVDAVIITSPTDVHAAQAERVLRAGKHALVEIPLATSLAEVDRLAQLAREQKRCLMVCHTQRFQPAIVEARRWIADGRLHVHHVLARFGFLRRENVNWLGRRRSWTDNLLWHHGCHAVDTSLWLLGATDATVTSQTAPPSPYLHIPLDLDVLLHTASDQLISVNMSYNTMIKFNDYLLIGEETTLLATLQRLESPDGVLLDKTSETDSGAIQAQDREFLAAIREEREPAVSAVSVRPTMAALQAAQDQYDHANSLR
ncbi:MAG TPA: Gfo/Idh/MocA family oxidoreductase [Chloroflexota bacterium]|nr:Gfo/Idh/MocA family oxidoreductase [Chloroflexota bacterium]